MNRMILPLAAAAAVFATPSSAQTATPMVIGAPTAENVLRSGTPIVLSLSEELTTKGKNLRSGHRFRLQVAEPVMVNGMVVIPAGSPAIGEITDVRNKGMWGKSGKINARLISVTVNGRAIRITGQFDDKGVTGTAGVVGAVAFVPVAGFFLTGTSAKVPVGATINGFIDEDVPLAMPASAPRYQAAPVQQALPVLPAAAQGAPSVQYAPAPSVQQAPAPAPAPTADKPRRSRVIIDGQGF